MNAQVFKRAAKIIRDQLKDKDNRKGFLAVCYTFHILGINRKSEEFKFFKKKYSDGGKNHHFWFGCPWEYDKTGYMIPHMNNQKARIKALMTCYKLTKGKKK